MSYILDIETLGKESTTAILSAAIIYVDFSQDFTYQQLIDEAVFVKFDAKAQLKAGRTYDRDTVKWWESQPEEVRKKSYNRSSEDISAEEGLEILRNFYAKNKKDTIWIRGALDNLALDSLAAAYNVEPVAPWWNYRDVRTAIDLLKETSKRAYCDVPGFDKSQVLKHDPVHDCAWDAIQMKYGE